MQKRPDIKAEIKYELWLVLAALAGLLSACCGPAGPAPGALYDRAHSYQCGAQMVTTHYAPDHLRLTLPGGRSYRLLRTRAASGLKYETRRGTDDVLFWNKGASAFLTLAGQDYPECRLVKG